MAGGALVFAGGYAYYQFSGLKTIVSTAHDTKAYFQKATEKIASSTPDSNEALRWLRQTATSYAAFIPGAKGYIDTAFDDLDAVRNKHGEEVDKIVKETYDQLKQATKSGMSIETAQKAWDIIQTFFKRTGELAGDAAEEIINNHPELKKQLGGNIDKLKEMGDQYGPEAKKQVDATWGQIQDIMKSGFSADTANKIRKVIQEKMQLLNKIKDEAWQKGMQEAKPYLEKSPQVKDFVEKNIDKLKQGSFRDLYEMIKKSVDAGNTDALESYLKKTVDGAKNKIGSGGLEQYFNMVPGGSEILPKLTQLKDIAEKYGDEAQTIAKETFEEMQQVLQKNVEKAQKLKEKAEKGKK